MKISCDMPALPTGCCWARVDEIGNVQLGRQRSPENRSKHFPTKYIRAANITGDGLDLSDLLDMEFTPDELPRYSLESGDIVLAEASGSSDQVGKPAIWRNTIENCCFQNTVIRLQPVIVLSEYLLVVFRSLYYSGAFSRLASGIGINHLTATKFASMYIPIAPLEEQAQIVSTSTRLLSVCDEQSAEHTRALRLITKLRKAVLNDAFEPQG